MMALAATGIAFLACAAWLGLLLAWHGFWRADVVLPDAMPLALPSVAALVPARDEAAHIAATVHALGRQTYQGHFRIIVIDDASRDQTAARAREAAVALQHPVEVIAADPLPAGWSGKLHALHCGARHLAATGGADLVWLSDADIVHGPDVLAALVAQHKAGGGAFDLVSVMVQLHCRTLWERLLVPAFIFFFQMLYPFRAIANPKSRVAGAAGGCILVSQRVLDGIGGFGALRGALIDDCTLAARIKQAGGRLWLGFNASSLSLRRTQGLAPLWRMVARTAFTQLHHSTLLLLGTMVALAIIFLAPPVLLVVGHGGTALMAGSAWAMMTLAYRPTLRRYGLATGHGLLLPVASLLYVLMTLDSARRHWLGQGAIWKGRAYAEPDPG